MLVHFRTLQFYSNKNNFCASDKNSKQARDMHLVRKLKQVLREGLSDETCADAVMELCRQLQTNTGRVQALDVLASSQAVGANTMLEVVETFLHWYETQGQL